MSNEIEVYAQSQIEQLRNRGELETEEQYRAVESVARESRKMIKEVEASIDPEIKQANLLHKSLLKKKKDVAQPLQGVIDIASRLMGAYSAKIAERERIQAREQAKIEAQQTAAKLIQKGEIEAAGSAIDRAENAPDSALAKVDLKPANRGTITRTTYEFEIDVKKLTKEWMIPDEKKIREAVNKSKGEVVIKGVTITPITKTHVKG